MLCTSYWGNFLPTDNAYDPDVSASELLIDKVDIHNVPCLIFLDNGAGMDRDQLLKMLRFVSVFILMFILVCGYKDADCFC